MPRPDRTARAISSLRHSTTKSREYAPSSSRIGSSRHCDAAAASLRSRVWCRARSPSAPRTGSSDLVSQPGRAAREPERERADGAVAGAEPAPSHARSPSRHQRAGERLPPAPGSPARPRASPTSGRRPPSRRRRWRATARHRSHRTRRRARQPGLDVVAQATARPGVRGAGLTWVDRGGGRIELHGADLPLRSLAQRLQLLVRADRARPSCSGSARPRRPRRAAPARRSGSAENSTTGMCAVW